MKVYNFVEIKKLAKQQNLKFASLVDANENRIIPFNGPAVNFEKHFARIENRFNGELVPNGQYYILLTDALRNTPNRFLIIKGEINEQMTIHQAQPLTPSNDVLSWSNALSMTQELAMLKAENLFLQKECELYKTRIEELQTEIEIIEAKNGGGGLLGEVNNNVGGFLKENSPLLINFLDKHFSLKEREISLKENATRKAPAQNFQPSTRKKNMIVGSPEHLELIRKLNAENNDESLNQHLDLLEQKDKAAHDAICNELNISLNE